MKRTLSIVIIASLLFGQLAWAGTDSLYVDTGNENEWKAYLIIGPGMEDRVSLKEAEFFRKAGYANEALHAKRFRRNKMIIYILGGASLAVATGFFLWAAESDDESDEKTGHWAGLSYTTSGLLLIGIGAAQGPRWAAPELAIEAAENYNSRRAP